MKHHFTITLAVLAFAPVSLFAATDFGSIKTLVDNFTQNVVTSVGYLMLTLAVVVFFWGIVQFIWASREGKVDEKTQGKSMMTWGLVALFVMFSVWGIITFAQKMLGSDFQNTTISVPKLKFDGSGGTGSNGSPLNSPADQFCSQAANGTPCGTDLYCSGGKCINMNP